MSDYSVSVKNSSGGQVNVAIYQTYPDIDGLPLVWLYQTVNDGNKNSLTWDLNWGLNWGTSSQQLVPGVAWTSGGPIQNVDPVAQKGKNAMKVGFSGGQFTTTLAAYHNEKVPAGSLQVATDSSFTVADAKAMSLAIYVNSLPAFTMRRQPNGKYLFGTHPTYWLCTTMHKQGVAVTGDYVSNAVELDFSNGVSAVSYELNKTLQFNLAA